MKYNFTKFIKYTGSARAYDGLCVGENAITFSSRFTQRINTDFVKLDYDNENQAIKVIPFNPDDYKGFVRHKEYFKIKHNTSSDQIYTSQVKQVMPMGRYDFKEEDEEGLICVKSNTPDST